MKLEGASRKVAPARREAGANVMTFLEAAIELLKRERKPLHYSKLSELAVKRDLLDHVGRDPQTAMQTALSNAVKKGQPDLLVRVKPGTFGLRHYPAPERTAAPAPADEPAAKTAATAGSSPGEKPEKAKPRRARGGRGR